MIGKKEKTYTSKETIGLLEEKLKKLSNKRQKIEGFVVSTQLFSSLEDNKKFLSYEKLPDEYKKKYVSAYTSTTDKERVKFYQLNDKTIIVIEDITKLGKDESEKYKLDDTGPNAFCIKEK